MSNSLTKTLTQFVSSAEAAAQKRGRWAQRFHITAPVGWINDPNGLCQIGDTYHAFFQYSPFDVNGGLKLWGHMQSRDMVSWEYVGAPLVPDEIFDCHGVYSGSAVVHDDVLSVLYTGNVKLTGEDFDYINTGREANTVLVESTDGGKTFGAKRCVMTNADYPSNCTCHVRDPKVWREGERYYMVQGARVKAPLTEPTKTCSVAHLHGERAGNDFGEVLLFSSEDLQSWQLECEITTPERFGFMWECPDYFELPSAAKAPSAAKTLQASATAPGAPTSEAALPILSVSPQGLEGGDWERRNIYASGYFVLDKPLLEGAVPESANFHLWDAGFDFYAPQTFAANDGRRIMIAWLGMPDTPEVSNASIEDGWQMCLSVPREITADAKDNVLQQPVRELAQYRGQHREGTSSLTVADVPAFDLAIENITESFVATFAHELKLSWSSETGWFEMGFDNTEKSPVGVGRTVRREPLPCLRNLRIVADASSLEVFANDGALVMSTLYYPTSYNVDVTSRGAEITLWNLEA